MAARRIAPGAVEQRACPGCGLVLPVSSGAVYRGHYHTSPECWSVYAEVLGREYGDAALFGRVHSLTVDTYAVQHAGGSHPDQSVAIHLTGLYLVLERGMKPTSVPRIHRRLSELVDRWPHFVPPSRAAERTVFDVAVCGSNDEYARTVRQWAAEVWDTWSQHHAEIESLVTRRVPLPARMEPPDRASA